LVFLKSAKSWQKKLLYAESERKRLSNILKETERELLSKDQKIKQAREMVNLEMRERQRVENECDELQKQWSALQNLVNSGGNQINNDTLQKIRNSVSTDKLLRTPSTRTPRKRDIIPLAEYSQESILDASELFEDSNDDLDQDTTRRRSRRSQSKLANQIVTSTTLTVHPNGHVHATSVLESVNDLAEKVKRQRKTRELSNQYTPAKAISEAEDHDFYKKNAVGVRESCAVCDKKIKFGKTCVKCQGCGIVCHPECKSEAEASSRCIPSEKICTPDKVFTPLMASSGGGERQKRMKTNYFQSPMLKNQY